MNSTQKSSIFGILAILSLAGCSDTSSQKQAPAPAPAPQAQPKCLTSQSAELIATPSWTGSVGSIFVNNCKLCHAEYANYNSVKANSFAVMSRINSGNMPQGQLMAPVEKSTLQSWVSAGMPYQEPLAPQPSTIPAPGPPSTPSTQSAPPATPSTGNTSNCVPTANKAVSFATDIQPIMNTYCISCHTQFGTYNVVKSNFASILQSVTSGNMPKNTSAKVPADKITLLKNWGSTNFSQ